MIQNTLLNNKISYMVACVSSFASVFVEDMAEICRQNRNWQIRILGSTERVLLMCISIICRKLRVKLFPVIFSALRIGGAAEPLRSNGVRRHGTPESLTRVSGERPVLITGGCCQFSAISGAVWG